MLAEYLVERYLPIKFEIYLTTHSRQSKQSDRSFTPPKPQSTLQY